VAVAWVYCCFIFRSAVGLRGDAIAACSDRGSRDKRPFQRCMWRAPEGGGREAETLAKGLFCSYRRACDSFRASRHTVGLKGMVMDPSTSLWASPNKGQHLNTTSSLQAFLCQVWDAQTS